MSARSRALDQLAEHFEDLAIKAGPWAAANYTATEKWAGAADMARRMAEEELWRERIPRKLTLWRVRAVSRIRVWCAPVRRGWEWVNTRE